MWSPKVAHLKKLMKIKVASESAYFLAKELPEPEVISLCIGTPNNSFFHEHIKPFHKPWEFFFFF